jgi:hypothetical protein
MGVVTLSSRDGGEASGRWQDSWVADHLQY